MSKTQLELRIAELQKLMQHAERLGFTEFAPAIRLEIENAKREIIKQDRGIVEK